ncbi:WYL domain-containing protein [Promicromonospora sukumoe]|uniref:Putative DNA-binding transcriptional regulator YafY n=1 Tax=Promicromonospora sukumoe TaxID=88382 RepID=A0A7W3J751_9MICO|nr:WYL domain-containing protein [Promicromonospora sukumoe]MBA8807532.1 putative DNA-binding transcriptional regulator YafY [Promicromonospora sukumoe]
MTSAQRLIGILGALQARRHTTAEALADEFGVSTRTILRDVQKLVDADIPVLTERGRYGGISLLPGQQVDLSRLTTSEADVLRAVGVDLERARVLGAETAARAAVGKFATRPGSPAPRRGVAPLSLADVVTVENRAWFAPREEGEPPDVAALARDLRQARRLRVTYRRSGESAARDLVVDPYGLLLRVDRWYLVADVAAAPRLFALTRLDGWALLDEARRLRAGTTLADVAAGLGQALETRHEVTVTALLDADGVDLARRILGSRLRTVGPADASGRVPITVAYAQVQAARQLLQFADHIEVTAPPEARSLLRRLATETATRHT